MFFTINFGAIRNAVHDEGITREVVWDPRTKTKAMPPKGLGFGRIEVEPLLDAGFGVATYYCGEIDPDSLAEFPSGIRALPEAGADGSRSGRLEIDCGVGVGHEPRRGLL
jgi:hypothetical protein